MHNRKKTRLQIWSNWHRRCNRRYWLWTARISLKSLREKSWKSFFHASFSLPTAMICSSNTVTLISVSTNTSRNQRSKRRSPNLRQKRTRYGTKWIGFRRIKRSESKVFSESRICRISRPSYSRSTHSKLKPSSTFYRSWSALESPGVRSDAWSKRNVKLIIHLPVWSTILTLTKTLFH